jgi:small subunit ribosomal protein S8
MDPIANMLIMLKNAGISSHDSILVPYSKIKHAIADCLLKEGYISSVTKKSQDKFPHLLLGIAYDNDNEPKLKGVQRISKPSRRVYQAVKDLKPVKNGYGLLVLSTPKGIMTNKDAKKELVGGEALFKIW